MLQPPIQAGNNQQVFNESVVFNSFTPVASVSRQQWGLFARDGGNKVDNVMHSAELQVENKNENEIQSVGEVENISSVTPEVESDHVNGVVNINNNDGNVVKGHPGIVEINGANNGNPHNSDDDGESDEDINETPSFNNMVEDGMGDGEEDDDDFVYPGGRGAGDALPEAIPPELGFIEKF